MTTLDAKTAAAAIEVLRQEARNVDAELEAAKDHKNELRIIYDKVDDRIRVLEMRKRDLEAKAKFIAGNDKDLARRAQDSE